MKRILLIIAVGLSISCNMAIAQSKKSKKNKKSKAPIEQTVEPVKENPIPDRPRNEEPPRATPTLPPPAPIDTPPRGSENTPSPAETPRPTPAPITTVEELGGKSEPVITNMPNGNINWTEQFIYAKGESVIDNAKFTNPAQAKAMATRGAVVVAQRNLLEIIKGVNVTSETTVQDMITTSDFIITRIDGVIKGAQQVGEAIERDGLIIVTMRVPLYDKDGLGPIVADNIPSSKKITNKPLNQEAATPEPGAAEALDKIVFNFKGKKIDPSMFPVIVDQNNNLVFDYAKIYDSKNGKFPKIVKTTDTMLKEFGYEKGIKVLDVLSADKGKIVIDNKNLKKVNWQKIGNTVAKIGKFLLLLL